MKKPNYYNFQLAHNSRQSGTFNIYQAKNGAIYIVLGNLKTELNLIQLSQLNIPILELIDFDHDLFNKYYKM